MSGKTAVERLLASIEYPERISEGVVSFAIRVDGMEVLAEEDGDRLVLRYVLDCPDSMLPALAGYAAGRMLREEATLAFGGGTPFLWQAAPASADAAALRRFFELFIDSCDWWRERAAPESAPAPDAEHEAIMIRP